MNTYKFFQDVKVSIWQRQYFSVEADTREEAMKKAMKYQYEDVSGCDCYERFEWLRETEELMFPHEQDGYSTIQLYEDGAVEPFATNADDEIKMNSLDFDKLMGIEKVAYREMAGYTAECTYHGTKGFFQAFHKDGKLHIVVICRKKQRAGIYAFYENWSNLVEHNASFRHHMATWLKSIYADSPTVDDEIHDWLTGHLTKMTASSDAIDDAVPFTLQDLTDAAAGYCSYREFQPSMLVGYQVVDDNGILPAGLCSSQIIKELNDARDILRKVQENEPHKTGMTIYPIYEGDIPEPSYI